MSLKSLGINLPNANKVRYEKDLPVRAGEIVTFGAIELLVLKNHTMSHPFNNVSDALLEGHVAEEDMKIDQEAFDKLDAQEQIKALQVYSTKPEKNKTMLYKGATQPEWQTTGLLNASIYNKVGQQIPGILVQKNFSTFWQMPTGEVKLLIARGESAESKSRAIIKSVSSSVETVVNQAEAMNDTLLTVVKENKSLKADMLRLKTLMIDELGIDATKVTGIDVSTSAVKQKAKEDADGIERSMDTDPSHLSAQEQMRIDKGEKK